MRHFVFTTIVSAALLSGCNTYLEKSYQKIYVDTPGVVGADCVLETEKQKYRVVTPQTILVEREPRNMMVTCEKAYYYKAVRKIDYSLQPLGSVLFPPGAPYDVASKSVYAFPEHISMVMEPDPEALAFLQEDMKKPVSEVQKKSLPEYEAPTPELNSDSDRAFDSGLKK